MYGLIAMDAKGNNPDKTQNQMSKNVLKDPHLYYMIQNYLMQNYLMQKKKNSGLSEQVMKPDGEDDIQGNGSLRPKNGQSDHLGMAANPEAPLSEQDAQKMGKTDLKTAKGTITDTEFPKGKALNAGKSNSAVEMAKQENPQDAIGWQSGHSQLKSEFPYQLEKELAAAKEQIAKQPSKKRNETDCR